MTTKMCGQPKWRKFYFLVSLLAVMGMVSLRGEEPATEVTLPIVTVPSPAAWTVKIGYEGDRPDDAPEVADSSGGKLRQIKSTVDGDLKRDVFSFAGGKKEEVWYRQGLRLMGDDRRAFVTTLASDEAEGTSIGLAFTSGFPGTDWIRPEQFQGMEAIGKIPCQVFRLGEASAWIDLAQRRPVRVQMGPMTYDFTFDPTPTTSLKMPTAFAEAWARYETLANRREAIRQAVAPAKK